MAAESQICKEIQVMFSKLENNAIQVQTQLAKLDAQLDFMEDQHDVFSANIESQVSYIAQMNLCHYMACAATKDIPWNKLLKLYTWKLHRQQLQRSSKR